VKVLLLSIILIGFLVGCSKAATISLVWNYPRFNASESGPCIDSPDTLRDLARVEIWAQAQGRSDSTLVLSRLAIGKEAKPDSVQIQQAEGVTFYWYFLFDLIGNRSCASNVASKKVVQPPAPGTLR